AAERMFTRGSWKLGKLAKLGKSSLEVNAESCTEIAMRLKCLKITGEPTNQPTTTSQPTNQPTKKESNIK
ncbi:hypothetical protein OS493_031476, partial [Desmophyllum pertusum]